MKTPNLLTVPKDGPTRKERLSAVKAVLMIETNRSDGIPEAPWTAAHMPTAREIGKPYGIKSTDGMFECIWAVGRLMEESGCLAEGKTEREAMRKVCENLGLPIDL